MPTLQYHFVRTTTPATAREIVSRYIAGQCDTIDVPVADVPVADVPVADVPVADVAVPDVAVPDVAVPDVAARLEISRKALVSALQSAKRYRDAIEKPPKVIDTLSSAVHAHAIFIQSCDHGLRIIAETAQGIFSRTISHVAVADFVPEFRAKLSAEDVNSLLKLLSKLKPDFVIITLRKTEPESVPCYENAKTRTAVDCVALLVETPGVSAEYNAYSVDGFPEWKNEFSPDGAIQVSAGEFRAAMKHVLSATDTTATRYALGAVCCTYNNGKMEVVSTDSKRLHLTTIVADCIGHYPDETQFLMPIHIIGALLDSVKTLPDDASILFAVLPSHAVAQAEKVELVWKTSDLGRFPKYRDVIPATASDVSTVSRADFLDTLELAAAAGSADCRSAEFIRSGRQLTIKVVNGKRTMQSDVDCSEDTDTKWRATLDVNFVAEYLRSETSERITVYVTPSEDGIVHGAVKFIGNDSNNVAIVMTLSDRK